MMAPPMIVTEDTPPDMLAGSMDLTVVLPDGHPLKMSVERSTPMMDLLVQVTTANKMSPAGYIIKPHNDRGLLPYKPSTPIGALDAWTIYIVPKQHAQCPSIKKPLKPLNQPFEQTFRLQVHLPRNQLYVSRISPKTRLADILVQVCSEKNLDPLKYSLRHPCHLDQVLNLNCSLADYKLQEVTLVCNRTHPVEVSTVDIMSLQRDSTNPAYRRNLCEGSVSGGSLEGRSLSPVPSDESSASPPPLALPPSRPTRKRRPAPKPPTINQKQIKEEVQQNGIQSSTVINHSRNSSDSSGYHEASVLSESPQSTSVPESLPHRKPGGTCHAPLKSSLSRSMTDVAAIEPSLHQATSYNSITSLNSITGRKKKSAPPPPPVAKGRAASLTEEQQRTPSISSTASSTTTLDGNEVAAAAKSATLPPSSRLNCAPPLTCPSPVDVEPPTTTPQGLDEGNVDVRMADEEIDRIFTDATRNHSSFDMDADEDHVMSLATLPTPPFSLEPCELKEICPIEEPLDWEYRLPAPPTFRDETRSPSVTEFGTITIANLSDVICSENHCKSNSNETVVPKGDTPVQNAEVKYEDDEKKCSTVVSDEMILNHTDDDKTAVKSNSPSASQFSIKKSKEIEKEEIDSAPVIKSVSKSSTLPQKINKDFDNKHQSRTLSSNSTLQNFSITTYKDTKPVEVFEDDSIKSSTGEKRDKSKDDAVFRAPKPRVKEPNLSRTSSFSMENKLNGPLIKRSVSYVSLLAANMPRTSQPYRAHLQDNLSSESQDMWPRLRKTTSELNIDSQVEDKIGHSNFRQEFSSELQSVQVLRNILSQSQANLSSIRDESDDYSHLNERDPPASDKRLEDTSEDNGEEDDKKWARSQSEEIQSDSFVKPKMINSSSLDQDHSTHYSSSLREAPSINLSTWSERPKRQVSIKNDHDCISGFGKKSLGQDGNVNKEASLTSKIVHSTNGSVRVELSKGENAPLKEKSKSISDLSRIPIVRSVELKKPFKAQCFDRTSLKPVISVEDINKSPPIDEDNSETNDCFIGVNSLARRFGVPQKRPVSMFVGSNITTQSDFEGIRPAAERVTNLENNFYNFNKAKKSHGNLYNTGSEFEDSKNSNINISKSYSQSNIATSDIKALAKISSGGFIENSKNNNCVNQMSSENQVPNRQINLTKVDIRPFNEVNKISYVAQDKKNANIAAETNQNTVTSSVYFRPNQTVERKPRPVSLQPVVKGFRITIDPVAIAAKESSSVKTKDLKSFQSHSSSNITNPVSTVNRISYNRALSTSDMPTNKDTAKEKITIRMNSVPPASSNKAEACGIPPPPPLMPVLKPAGERKGVKHLPPPEADPRDMLLHSIRSFGKDSLKKVSK